MNDTGTPETPETPEAPEAPANTSIPQPDSIPTGFRRLFGFVRHIIEIIILGVFLLAICRVVPSEISGLLEGLFVVVSHVATGSAPKHWVDRYSWVFVAVPAVALVVLLVTTAIQRWRASVEKPGGTALRLIKKALRQPVYWAAAMAAVAAVGLSRRYGQAQGMDAWVVLILLLAGSRFFKRPIPYALSMLIFLGLAYGLLFWKVSYPVIQYVDRGFSHPIMVKHRDMLPDVLVPGIFMPLRSVLLVLLPFLIAVYCVRRGFAWWKYLLGWLACWVIVFGVLFLRLPEVKDTVFVALNLVFIFLLARLPLQHRTLENMLGIPLAGAPSDSVSRARRALSSLFGHAMVLFLVLLVMGFAVLGHYERKMMQTIMKGPTPPFYSPALVNAYDSMKDLFNKKKSKRMTLETSMPREEYNLLSSMYRTPRPLFEEIWSVVDPATLEQMLTPLQPGFDAFAKAARADYCLFHDGERGVTPHFINLRLVSYGLMMRARLRIHQGRTAEALADIETVLKVAGLLNTDPTGTLVVHMIGVALRANAISAAGDYFLFYRQDPAALDQLRQMLERNASVVRIAFPSEILRHSEPGFGPVVPFFEIVMPGVIRAGEAFYWRWVQFDQLLLGTALESYRRDQGRYPDRLEELVPKYMTRLPLDPIEGELYPYENLGDDVKLGPPAYLTREEVHEWLFPMPKDNSELRKHLEAFKAIKAKKQGGGER